MVRKLVVGNWKMNGRRAVNAKLVSAMLDQLPDTVDVAVCVPFPYLEQVSALANGSSVAVGAQDVSAFEDGAYTGQVSAPMLREFGCRFAIVGHSERRALAGEHDADVARKAAVALAAGITPIVCVGETLAERDAGEVSKVLHRQLDALDGVVSDADFGGLVVAYEPVWAIGSGRAASAEQVGEVLALIRAWLAKRTRDAAQVRILYGGSVKADSAAWLFGLDDADGVLVGGASLIAEEFVSICQAAAAASSTGNQEGVIRADG